MERRIGSVASPLDALNALERNLKRERRVFAMLIALLAFAGLIAAVVTAFSIGAASLSNQAARLRTVTAQTNEVLGRHFTFLENVRLLLTLNQAGTFTPLPTPTQHRCTPAFPDLADAPSLQAFCDHTVQMASHAGSDWPVLFVMLDGSAAWGYRLVPKRSSVNDEPMHSGVDRARILAETALLRMNARGIDPQEPGRWHDIAWFRPPPGLGFAPELVLGAATVIKDGKPYALVMTSVDLTKLSQAPNTSGIAPTLFDGDGTMLSGTLSPPVAQYVDRIVSTLSVERFHLLTRFGWALREQPLEYQFGHYTLALSWGDAFALIRTPLIIILLMTAALVALLVALSRYWNRHVLERTYGEATRALEGELLNHLLVHATPVGLCIVRQRDFEIVIANQIVRNVLGLDEHATRLPAALCVEFEKHMPYAPSTPRDTPIYVLPFSLAREDGGSVHLEITYAPASMNREEVMFCAFADMSEHHEAERLLREAKRTSDDAARSKVSFFAAMSHEIRTPLASLVGNIELVARGPLAPEQEARVQAMQVSSSELLQIVSDVLDFSKIDVGAMTLSEEPESIAALLVRIALTHAPLAVHSQLPFYLVVDRAIPARLYFDSVRLAQIVNNLLSNAFKFTHSGKIVLRANWLGDALELSVADSGVGMPDSLKARLFQPFTQGDEHRLTEARGTGLGLSICGRLAKLMRGRCEVESTLGVGTRVIVTLPLRVSGETTAGDEWTLPEVHPAMLCRAPENHEWLTNLFDPKVSAPTWLSTNEPPPREGAWDYLLVTSEYSADDVKRLWGSMANVIWLSQDGPLVPLAREDGGVEVSLYSLAGIRTATQMLRVRPEAAAHGGTLAAPAAGSAGTAVARVPQAPQAPQNSEFRRLNVLIAEDNLLNRSLLRDQLRTLGANVTEAKDGEEALARLDDVRVDVMLTDLNMPKMNGYELLQAARAKHAALPIYAVSGNALPEQIAQGRLSGFSDYLSKPVPLAALARVLADVAEHLPDTAQDAIAQPAPAQPENNNPNTVSDTSDTSDMSDMSHLSDEIDDDADLPRFPALSPALAPLFVEQADHDIADYARIASTHDFQRLRDWAHRVSGGLAVLGPSMLNEACLELRATLREAGQWTDEVSAFSEEVVAELEVLREQAAMRDSA